MLSTLNATRPLISEQASELESDIQHTVDWVRQWLVAFDTGKIQLVSFDRSDICSALDLKWTDLSLMKNYLLRC